MINKQALIRKTIKKKPPKRKNKVMVLSSRSRLFDDRLDLIPERWKGVLKYIDNQYVRANAGANYLLYAFRVNDLYDLDPLILSGSFSRFKEIMQFYTYFRALKGALHWEASLAETFALMWGYCFSTVNLASVVTTRDDAVNVVENASAAPMGIISPKGGMDKVVLDVEFDIGALILGNIQQYKTNIEYTGTISTGPANPLYFNLVLASPTSASIPNGVINSLTFAIQAEFFGRVNIRA